MPKTTNIPMEDPRKQEAAEFVIKLFSAITSAYNQQEIKFVPMLREKRHRNNNCKRSKMSEIPTLGKYDAYCFVIPSALLRDFCENRLEVVLSSTALRDKFRNAGLGHAFRHLDKAVRIDNKAYYSVYRFSAGYLDHIWRREVNNG